MNRIKNESSLIDKRTISRVKTGNIPVRTGAGAPAAPAAPTRLINEPINEFISLSHGGRNEKYRRKSSWPAIQLERNPTNKQTNKQITKSGSERANKKEGINQLPLEKEGRFRLSVIFKVNYKSGDKATSHEEMHR